LTTQQLLIFLSDLPTAATLIWGTAW